METGDVVTTPGWCWHGQPAYWFDGLDVPLTHLLEPMFYEEPSEKHQAADQKDGIGRRAIPPCRRADVDSFHVQAHGRHGWRRQRNPAAVNRLWASMTGMAQGTAATLRPPLRRERSR
jgi:gentisate 1,2-dioxygenase